MVALNQTFNASDVDPSVAGNTDPFPAGWYKMMITDGEQKATKSGNGDWYLNLTFEVVEGEYKGRKCWKMLNLQNKNETAMEIAYRELSAICHAVGVLQIQDTQQLHNLPMYCQVKVTPPQPKNDGSGGEYPAKNEINGYQPIDAQPQSAPQSPPAAPAAPAAPASSAPAPEPAGGDDVPPWMRK